MLAERHVEFATLIEAAESVEASSVEIVEILRRLCALRFAVSDQFVETTAVAVETLRVVRHLDGCFESLLQMRVEVYEMRIDVIQKGAAWSQSKRGRKSAAERFDVAPG
jgi:hypothetical protein